MEPRGGAVVLWHHVFPLTGPGRTWIRTLYLIWSCRHLLTFGYEKSILTEQPECSSLNVNPMFLWCQNVPIILIAPRINIQGLGLQGPMWFGTGCRFYLSSHQSWPGLLPCFHSGHVAVHWTCQANCQCSAFEFFLSFIWKVFFLDISVAIFLTLSGLCWDVTSSGRASLITLWK